MFRSGYSTTTPVVKNLIIVNALMFLPVLLGTNIIAGTFDFTRHFALYYPGSEYFKPYQFVTHMFMHANIAHIFFNMFGLWMFGKVLEGVWGSKRFLFYYFFTGLGAAALHTFVNYLEIAPMQHSYVDFLANPSPDAFMAFIHKYSGFFNDFYPGVESKVNEFISSWQQNPGNQNFITETDDFIRQAIEARMNIPTVGASGAIFGVLLAFGMLFPNTELMLLFPPVPIKAKWFVIGYGCIELYSGFAEPGSNIAHFAHIGGMLFGFILIKYWNRTRKTFY
ncbi:MAG: rhomboid family intramembrane serine protease [Bacteroidia bacterium]|nr:rhomboid family intramembrane serine protease [Bacteroidia bacterium]